MVLNVLLSIGSFFFIINVK